VSTFDVALLLHIVAAIAFFAGLLLAAAASVKASRRVDPVEIAVLLSLARFGALLVALSGVAVLALGFWLVELANREPSEAWLSASVALLIVAFVLGALGGQAPKRARKLATQAAAEGAPPVEEILAALANPVARGANTIATLASLAILVLMVWRPGG